MSPKTKSMHLLLVEDDDDLRELMADLFRGEFSKVSEANNGRDALRMIMDDPSIAVVLSDVRMPNGDGIELIKALHSLSRPQKPVVFLVTGFSDFDLTEAKKFGVRDVFAKPCQFSELIKRISDSL
jgi:CheY-like chemotaxis protein